MSKVSITRSKLDNLAVSISTKSGANLPLTLDQMKTAVDNMSGSSDFTTATVTVINNMTIAYTFFVPTIYNGQEAEGNYTAGVGTSTTTVILYQGMASMWSVDIDISSVNGSAVIDDGVAIITGDCTITISD